MPDGERDVDRTLRRAALGTQVAQLFREQVTSGRWPVGGQIPTETELVDWSGAGRNTVREAIGSLVEAGILRREQGRGTFVLTTSDVRAAIGRRVAATSRRDSLELRLALDAAAARTAAVRRTDDDARRLAVLLEARRDAWTAGDPAERARADTALHRAVVAATGNQLLAEVYEGLLTVFEVVLDEDVQGATDELAELHAQLVAAIAGRDPDRAAATTAQLLQPMIDELGQA